MENNTGNNTDQYFWITRTNYDRLFGNYLNFLIFDQEFHMANMSLSLRFIELARSRVDFWNQVQSVMEENYNPVYEGDLENYATQRHWYLTILGRILDRKIAYLNFIDYISQRDILRYEATIVTPLNHHEWPEEELYNIAITIQLNI